MSPPRLALAVIGDEIGPSLPEMLSFCRENDVRRLDMRTVDGRNLLGMTLDEVNAVGTTLRNAGIEVPTFVSPVLKWAAPGKTPVGGKVDFAFDPATCPARDPLAHAFDVAAVLGATRIRVFSFLRHPDFQPDELRESVDRLVNLAARGDITVEMENEPVCNIGSVAELARFFEAQPEATPLLRPLVDIGNSWFMDAPPSDADIALLAPQVDLIHLKDKDFTARRAVPLGDGAVPWAAELTRLMAGVTVPEVTASLEIHCFDDARNAAARSVAALRRIAGEIGIDIV
jgi:sugar phosphate isomerase/epimerase